MGLYGQGFRSFTQLPHVAEAGGKVVAGKLIGVKPKNLNPYFSTAISLAANAATGAFALAGSIGKGIHDPAGAWEHAPEGIADFVQSVDLLEPGISGPERFMRLANLWSTAAGGLHGAERGYAKFKEFTNSDPWTKAQGGFAGVAKKFGLSPEHAEAILDTGAPQTVTRAKQTLPGERTGMVTRTRGDIRSDLTAIQTTIQERLSASQRDIRRRGRRAGATSLFDPTLWQNLVHAAYLYAELGHETPEAIRNEMMKDFGLDQRWRKMIFAASQVGHTSYNSDRPYIDIKKGGHPRVASFEDLWQFADPRTGVIRMNPIFGDPSNYGVDYDPLTDLKLFATGGYPFGFSHEAYARMGWSSAKPGVSTRYKKALTGAPGEKVLSMIVSQTPDSIRSSGQGADFLEGAFSNAVKRGVLSESDVLEDVNPILKSYGLKEIESIGHFAAQMNKLSFKNRKIILDKIGSGPLAKLAGVKDVSQISNTLLDPAAFGRESKILGFSYLDPNATVGVKAHDLGSVYNVTYPEAHGGIALGYSSPVSIETLYPSKFSTMKNPLRSIRLGETSKSIPVPSDLWEGMIPGKHDPLWELPSNNPAVRSKTAVREMLNVLSDQLQRRLWYSVRY